MSCILWKHCCQRMTCTLTAQHAASGKFLEPCSQFLKMFLIKIALLNPLMSMGFFNGNFNGISRDATNTGFGGWIPRVFGPRISISWHENDMFMPGYGIMIMMIIWLIIYNGIHSSFAGFGETITGFWVLRMVGSFSLLSFFQRYYFVCWLVPEARIRLALPLKENQAFAECVAFILRIRLRCSAVTILHQWLE